MLQLWRTEKGVLIWETDGVREEVGYRDTQYLEILRLLDSAEIPENGSGNGNAAHNCSTERC